MKEAKIEKKNKDNMNKNQYFLQSNKPYIL